MDFATFINAFITFLANANHVDVTFQNNTKTVLGLTAKAPVTFDSELEAFVTKAITEFGLPKEAFKLVTIKTGKPMLTVTTGTFRLHINKKFFQ